VDQSGNGHKKNDGKVVEYSICAIHGTIVYDGCRLYPVVELAGWRVDLFSRNMVGGAIGASLATKDKAILLSLKNERTNYERFAKLSVFRYIETFYNSDRQHRQWANWSAS
jgi:hypothetical protein